MMMLPPLCPHLHSRAGGCDLLFRDVTTHAPLDLVWHLHICWLALKRLTEDLCQEVLHMGCPKSGDSSDNPHIPTLLWR